MPVPRVRVPSSRTPRRTRCGGSKVDVVEEDWGMSPDSREPPGCGEEAEADDDASRDDDEVEVEAGVGVGGAGVGDAGEKTEGEVEARPDDRRGTSLFGVRNALFEVERDIVPPEEG